MTELSKLEQEILDAMWSSGTALTVSPTMAKAAAIVCRKKIELALDYNPALVVQELCGMKTYEEVKDQWITDNL